MASDPKPRAKKTPLQQYKRAHDDKPLFYLGTKQDIKDESLEDIGAMVNELWKTIAGANKADARFFLSNRKPVYLHLAHKVELELFSMSSLKSLLNDLVYFYFRTSTTEDGETARAYKTRLAPNFIVTQMLNNPRYIYPLPELDRVVTAPYFTEKYKLHQQPGYNAASRTYYYLNDPRLSAINVPAEPTEEQAAAARRLILEDMLIDFPFSSDAERANAVSTMLEPFIRSWFDVTPFRLIESARAGTGKGLLGDALLYPFLGDMPTRSPEPKNSEGWQKLITTLLLTIPSVVFFDNIKRPVNDGSLESILTNPLWGDRMLGGNQHVQMLNQATWLFAGNNVQIGEEIARRTVRIRMVAKTATPHQRKAFVHNPLRAWIMQHRADIVSACLIMIQYWIVKGRPLYDDAPSLGSYEKWSSELHGILTVNGIPGFLGNMQDMIDLDKYDWDDLTEVVDLLWQMRQTTVFSANDVFQLITDNPELPINLGNNGERAQRCTLGKLLSRNRERVFAVTSDTLKADRTVTVNLEVQLLASGTVKRAMLWRLERITERWAATVDAEQDSDAIFECWVQENQQRMKTGEILIEEPKVTLSQAQEKK